MNRLKTWALAVTMAGVLSVHAQQRIPTVENLLQKMTLEEKLGQLNLITPGGVVTGELVSKNVEEKLKSGQVGGMFNAGSMEVLRAAQDVAVKKTRLKIPLIIGADVIHGYKTTYPIPLGLSSSWDMDLMEKTAQMSAKESTASGVNWNFSPMVDIARDPRWGRIAEGSGEDPYLGSKIAEAVIKGYQGTDLSDPATMMACVKHFALYGAAESGRDYNSVDMSRLKMYNQYLPPYKAAVDAGAGSVMSSFNDVDGVPASGNHWLLTELLRNQWGFNGFVVSDYTSVNEMSAHGLGDLQAVSALALKAGLDMDMVGEGFLTTLKKSLDEGKVTEAEITEACRRVLEAKYKLGLFDDPYRYLDPKREKTDILTPENRKLAREAATKSFVLLQNPGQILPLNKTANIALVGPLANDKANMLGTWAPTGDPSLSVPILDGLKQVASQATITYAKGANITDVPRMVESSNALGTKVVLDQRSPEELLNEAVAVAQKADVVVAVVGEASEMSGEASSRTDISIPESQKKLIRALAKTGKPLVLVLMSGRPLTIAEESELPVAIMEVWFPGVEAGNAVADALFGDVNPSGKLTATWPRNVGQIPIYYSMKHTGRPKSGDGFQKFRSNYMDVPNTPLFPFGYGLSYTNFSFKDLELSKKEIEQGENLEVSVTVTNTGKYDGEEVVQLYLQDVVRSITQPVRELKGFQKVALKKGESKKVTLTLTPNDLKFYNGNLDYVSEPGEFKVFVGGDSNAELESSFELK